METLRLTRLHLCSPETFAPYFKSEKPRESNPNPTLVPFILLGQSKDGLKIDSQMALQHRSQFFFIFLSKEFFFFFKKI